MTCLIAPPAFRPDNNDADPRQQLLGRLTQSYQALLNQWRELGLTPGLFLPASQGLARLTEWSQPQLLELQQALVGLARHPQACAAMADVLGQIAARRTPAPDLSDLSLTMKRRLVLIRPLLDLQPTMQSWPRIDGDPLVAPPGLPQSLRSGRSELLAHWLKPVKSKPRWRARSLMNQPWRVKSQL